LRPHPWHQDHEMLLERSLTKVEQRQGETTLNPME
jgi:hypothetical protein